MAEKSEIARFIAAARSSARGSRYSAFARFRALVKADCQVLTHAPSDRANVFCPELFMFTSMLEQCFFLSEQSGPNVRRMSNAVGPLRKFWGSEGAETPLKPPFSAVRGRICPQVPALGCCPSGQNVRSRIGGPDKLSEIWLKTGTLSGVWTQK